MNNDAFKVYPIGRVARQDDGIYIKLDKKYAPALKQLDHFSHIQILWWLNEFDDEFYRELLQGEPPYENAPLTGVFASRSPLRPNPIGLTVAKIENIDFDNAIIKIGNIDAFDGTPVVDIKAYIPICDRVEKVSVPKWIEHWDDWFPIEGMELEDE